MTIRNQIIITRKIILILDIFKVKIIAIITMIIIRRTKIIMTIKIILIIDIRKKNSNNNNDK